MTKRPSRALPWLGAIAAAAMAAIAASAIGMGRFRDRYRQGDFLGVRMEVLDVRTEP